MRTRVLTTVLVGAMFLTAMWGAVARAQSIDTNLEITQFSMARSAHRTGISPRKREAIPMPLCTGGSVTRDSTITSVEDVTPAGGSPSSE